LKCKEKLEYYLSLKSPKKLTGLIPYFNPAITSASVVASVPSLKDVGTLGIAS
jgi:hypothetical protein